MKTKNMPHAKYLRRVAAEKRLEANHYSSEFYISNYSNTPGGKHERKVLDERIKDYAALGQRPSRMMGGL